MLGQAIGGLLPAAAAVALSPIPIVALVLVLDGVRARVSAPAFAAGWIAGLSVVSTLVVTLFNGSSDPDSGVASGVNWGKAAIGVALLVMAVRQWRKRPRDGEHQEMPAWMDTVGSVSAPKALGLGVVLSAANPKNLALTAAAAASIAEAGLGGTDTVIAVATFVAIASVTVVGAVLFAVLAPSASRRPLTAIRTFMAANNAVIMMVILLIFGLKILGEALGGIWT